MALFWNWIKSIFNKPVYDTDKQIESNSPKKEITVETNSISTPRNPDWTTLWKTCFIDQNRKAEIQTICAKILSYKDKYLFVEDKTGVPWYLIAALHYREASLNFKTCLHNGDPLPGPTTHVPRGRGPFISWEMAAIDALKYDGLDKIKFTSIESCLVMAEKFNGIGYRRTSEYSPYIWAGTNHHDETGKYVGDGVYSSIAVEKQLGVAAIFRGLDV